MKRQRTSFVTPTKKARSTPRKKIPSSTVVPRNILRTKTGLPSKLLVVHRYSESVAPTSTTGVPFTYQFSCNGMFDPNITGTGHQPYEFDQLNGIYNHYTVLKSKITVWIGTEHANQAQQSLTGVYIEDDTTVTPAATYGALCEQSTGKWKPYVVTNQPNKFVIFWDAKKAFGGDILDNDDLQGTGAANPVEQQFFTIWAGDATGSTTTSYEVHVDIEYTAMWEELKNLASS